jgi:hypothetical protein
VLDSSAELKSLTQILQKDSTGADAVLSRMARLAGTSVDFRFRNRNDTALAAYLYGIVVTSPNALLVACRIALTAPNTWLSNQLVSLIMSGWANSSSSTEQSLNVEGGWDSIGPVSINSRLRDETGVDVIQIGPIFGGQIMFPADRIGVPADERFQISTRDSVVKVGDSSANTQVNGSPVETSVTKSTRRITPQMEAL